MDTPILADAGVATPVDRRPPGRQRVALALQAGGNAPERRLERRRAFWEAVTDRGIPYGTASGWRCRGRMPASACMVTAIVTGADRLAARWRCRRVLGGVSLASVLSVTAAWAAPVTLALDAGHASMGLRAYAMGLLSMDGHFERFHGTLAVDSAHPDTCHIALSVEVRSLRMEDASVGRDMLSPALLDAARFPGMNFDGNCVGAGIAGDLTMHGVTRPVTLAISRHDGLYRAQAQINRADWGVSGRPLAAGPQVRIRFEVRLPPSIALQTTQQ